MHRLANFVTRKPRTVITAVLMLTLLFAVGARHTTFTTDIKDFFPNSDPRVLTYNRIAEEFGGADYMMLAVTADDIFTTATLERLEVLTERLSIIPGISEVRSITNASQMRNIDGALEIAPLLDTVPTTPQDLASFKDRILADEMYRDSLVSLDGSATLLAMQVDPDVERAEVVLAVQDVTNSYSGPEELYLTGTPVLNEILISSMQSDLKRLMPIVLFILAVVLYLHFRSIRGATLPFLTVLMSVVWTVGLMGYLGKSLSPLSSVMPIILISLGNAYAIYVIARCREDQEHKPGETVRRALAAVGVAVLAAGATTTAGFSSNASSSITQMRDFGLFTAFGVFAALLISLTFVPAVLSLLRPDKTVAAVNGTEKGLVARLLDSISHWAVTRSAATLAATMILVGLAMAGLPQLSSDSNFFNFFDPSSEARQAYELVKLRFGGSETIEIAIEGDLKDPEVLSAMDRISADLRLIPDLSEPFSVTNVVKRVDKALDPDSEGRIPDSSDLLAQYYLLLEMDANSPLGRFVNFDYTRGRIQARTSDTSAVGIARNTALVETSIERHLGSKATATITGAIVLMDALVAMLVKSQLLSLLISLGLVCALVRLLLRSWEGSLVSTAVITLVTGVIFGIMGWLKIPLDIVTVLISSIGIGVGIDFSIHIYSRYQEEQSNGMAWQDALKTAITSTGKAILVNTVSIVAGFLVLANSSFPPLRYFGILVTGSMLLAAAGALGFMPAVISFRQKLNDRRQASIGR